MKTIEYYNVYNQDYIRTARYGERLIKVMQLSHYDEAVRDITDVIEKKSVNISIRYNQGLQRTCSLTVNNAYGTSRDSPFFVNSKFKVYFGVAGEADTYWFSQGIFITKTLTYQNGKISISAVDKFGFFTNDLNQHNLTSSVIVPAGTDAVELIKDIIALDMGNGMITDTTEPNIDSGLHKVLLPRDITGSANNSYGSILTETATALCADIYYNGDGRLCVTKSYTDDYKSYAPVWNFENVKNLSEVYNQGAIYNSITCCGADSNGRLYSYTAENNNAQSDINISVIGRKSLYEKSTICSNEERCKDYAEYKLKQYTMMAVTAGFEAEMLPHLNANEIIRIGQNDYVVQEVRKASDKMSVSACNVKFLPFSDWG